MCKLVIILFLTLFSLSETTHSGDYQHPRESLSRNKTKLIKIKREILKTKQAVKTIDRKERSEVTGLNKIEGILSKKRKELKFLNAEIDQLKSRIENTTNQISGLEKNIRTMNLKLKTCLKTTYKMGRPGYLKAVLSSSSYEDTSRHYKYISIMIKYNSELIKKYEKSIVALREKKKELLEDQDSLFALKVEKEKRESDMEARIEKKNNALKSFKKKKSIYTTHVKELEQYSKSLG